MLFSSRVLHDYTNGCSNVSTIEPYSQLLEPIIAERPTDSAAAPGRNRHRLRLSLASALLSASATSQIPDMLPSPSHKPPAGLSFRTPDVLSRDFITRRTDQSSRLSRSTRAEASNHRNLLSKLASRGQLGVDAVSPSSAARGASPSLFGILLMMLAGLAGLTPHDRAASSFD